MSVDKSNGVHCFLVYGLYEGVNVPALQRYLVDSFDILSYWNHLPLIYIVKTKLTVSELTAKLMPFFPNKLFLVAEIDATNVNGFLPPASWEWFRTPAPPYKVAAPKALLGDILSRQS
ncbi:UNVERIFIED_ORG: hypothetical protein QE446_003494 [Rhizobium sp. SORGH_AS260]|uniref:hypothetical protein n=1 Tax=Agrobacterium sp. SORGH_AS_0440 TaxID=3041757 RepID=UPI001612BFF7|nr:hypothetical protein [Agrobacterium sp. SORGH_AS_0440]MBB2904351.1 hypothetical protein [Rhizobium sp. RAS22]MDP9732552.1 hypothetical protein [Rhizobium sp. SORGH_AS_0285]MDP9755618.1 hypothetical protein [Rhizobium sp. SORGH_AS_0260]MDR6081725.1 hypothetical protein [Agrobacterium sp. SORGH_AS_0440]